MCPLSRMDSRFRVGELTRSSETSHAVVRNHPPTRSTLLTRSSGSAIALPRSTHPLARDPSPTCLTSPLAAPGTTRAVVRRPLSTHPASQARCLTLLTPSPGIARPVVRQHTPRRPAPPARLSGPAFPGDRKPTRGRLQHTSTRRGAHSQSSGTIHVVVRQPVSNDWHQSRACRASSSKWLTPLAVMSGTSRDRSGDRSRLPPTPVAVASGVGQSSVRALASPCRFARPRV